MRNAYAEGDPLRCAADHSNLANHQEAANGEPTTFLAHRLAGGVLLFQVDFGFVHRRLRRPGDEFRALRTAEAAAA